MKKYKIGLYIALVLSVVMGIVTYEYIFYRQIPDTLYLEEGNVEEIEFALPVTANLVASEEAYIETWDNGRETENSYIWELKLFGILPLKDVEVQVVEEQQVYPIGIPIGIYVKTDGVLVADLGTMELTDGTEICPCENILQEGDYILAIDGESISKKKEVIQKVRESEGQPLIMRIRRNNQISDVKVTPLQNKEGDYQIGAWVRDSAQGIGTLTYIDENNRFGALGHGVNDIDTSELMEIAYGRVYETQIISIQKGTSGKPGEISGIVRFMEEAKQGDIELNTPNGIYGVMERAPEAAGLTAELLYPIAMKQEIEIGDAQILCTINGERSFYDAIITEIDYSQSKGNRGLVVEITDPALLAQTGGIVQGMSGSPILQNGKLIGAVTHVFVNDPTKGYGIFIENMLEH
ncbi:MAG: SpoIVB peptidase [Lachnospiraceae bacterium]|nr:SpoIVB peptidase [Lachnospiraceae bacterium]